MKKKLEKDFFRLMNNAIFGKTMENVKKYKNIKLVAIEARRNYLVSEFNYHTTNFLGKIKTQILMNKLIYLGL